MFLPQRTQRAQKRNCGLPIADCELPGYLGVLCVLCGYLFGCAHQTIAAPQEVLTVDAMTFQAGLVSIADGRATFRVAVTQNKAGENRTLALDQLVRWGNPVAPRAQAIVALADGGQIVAAADLSGGDVLKLEKEELVVRTE